MKKIKLFAGLFSTTIVPVMIATVSSGAFAAPDPLSKGPIPYSSRARTAAQAAYNHSKIMTDPDCQLTPERVAHSEIDVSILPEGICDDKKAEVVYGPALVFSPVDGAFRGGLVACLDGQPQFAMRASIGTGGLGKTKTGDRKTPVGTHWLGYPRHSKHFGIFIPVGYPNLDDISKGRTGSAIGIHGPLRFMTCVPRTSLSRNWTAGCLALGRDSQIIELSEWIFDHWPVKLTVTAN